MIAQNLKKSILQEAISGRLVSQIESEGTADDLLQQIAKEHREAFLAQQTKEKAEAEANGKKFTPKKYVPLTFSVISEDEQPFEIPNSWRWVRLGEIAYAASGSTPDKTCFVNNGIPYLKGYNIRNQKVDFDFCPQYIKEDTHNNQLKRSKTQVGDLIMNIVGPPLGKLAIIPSSLPECNFNQAHVLIRFFSFKELLTKYTFFFLSEMSVINSMDKRGTAGQQNISLSQVKNIPIPLPPLSEQRRIVSKLESLLPKIDSLSETETRLSVLESTLGDRLWKSVLQEAIAGRLTTQLESDGTADILLDQIKAAHREAFLAEQAKDKAAAEKSGKKFVPKKYTPLTFSQIPQSEIPFNIPDNWKWVRLGEICSLSDGIRKTNETYNNLDARYLRGKAEAKTMQSGKFVKKGDDIILVDGENSGEVFAVPEDGYMGSTFKQLVILNGLNKEFVKFFILSKKDNLRNSKKGSAIPHLNKELFFSFSFPLPPLSEQERIVAKLDRLRGALGRD